MHPIQMVDLQREYHAIKPEVDAAVMDVLESCAFINGPQVQRFATNLAAYNGAKHVIPCANGTDALQIAMMALDLKPGDEVIAPSFTYIATTEVIALLRLTVVFVEVDPKTFCLDIAAVEGAITPKTKAIVPVHLYGQSTDMEPLLALAKKHNLAVIEDNAQAMGCDYTFSNGHTKKTGSMGTIGCTSFYPSKNLGAYGDGGAITTNDDDLAVKIRMIANHGQSKRYYHEMVGCNSRLDTIQAAILDVKLKHLDRYIAARQQVAAYYDNAFAGHPKIKTPYRHPSSTHVFHQYTLVLEGLDRDALSAYLAARKIPSMIYYPVPAHRQQMFAAAGGSTASLPVTDWLTERVISLPIHTEMDEAQLQAITSNVLAFADN